MCPLFGLSAAPHRASFWLLDARTACRSRVTFAENGTPLVEKQPLAAYVTSSAPEKAHGPDRPGPAFHARASE